MLGPETRAGVRLRKSYTVIDGTGSHQHDKHGKCVAHSDVGVNRQHDRRVCRRGRVRGAREIDAFRRDGLWVSEHRIETSVGDGA